MAEWVEGIHRALVLGLVLIAGTSIEQAPSVGPLYLDFSNAFDKVDHGIILHKLRAIGITGNIDIWLFHFLTGKSLFVR